MVVEETINANHKIIDPLNTLNTTGNLMNKDEN